VYLREQPAECGPEVTIELIFPEVPIGKPVGRGTRSATAAAAKDLEGQAVHAPPPLTLNVLPLVYENLLAWTKARFAARCDDGTYGAALV